MRKLGLLWREHQPRGNAKNSTFFMSIVMGFLAYVNGTLFWGHLQGFFGMESIGTVAKSWLLLPLYGFITLMLIGGALLSMYSAFSRNKDV